MPFNPDQPRPIGRRAGQDATTADEDHIHITLDGVELLPVVYETEAAGSAKMTQYTDQCGYSESEKLGAGTMTLTVNAILYKSYVQEIYGTYETGDLVEVTHPAEIGSFEMNIQDVTIAQAGDHNDWVGDDGNVYEIFDTQIQLKSPNAETEQ